MTAEQLRRAMTAQAAAEAAFGPIEVWEEVDSTNSELKRRAMAGAPDGTVLIACRQTGGRGRRGRTFFSPDGGLYMSVLLRRSIPCEVLPLLTIAAATAVALAIEQQIGRSVALKWVNDVYLDARKVCGILAEAVTDGTRETPSIVVGVGVNLQVPAGGFPAELPTAGALFAAPPAAETVAALAAGILTRLGSYAAHLEARAYLPDYRARSFLLGQTVAFCERGTWSEGLAEAIDDDGGLQVRLSDGTARVLRSGEVTMHRG